MHQKLKEELIKVIFFLFFEQILHPCPILPVTSSMGIGFGQISENGPDPNRSGRPVEEDKKKKRKNLQKK